MARRLLSPSLRCDPPEQVFNADSAAAVTPVDDAAADVVKAAWAVWLPGQDVPLMWER